MRPLDIFLKSSGMPFNNMYDMTPAITPYAMLNDWNQHAVSEEPSNNVLVCQRDDYKRKKGRYSIAYIKPVDFHNTRFIRFHRRFAKNYSDALPNHQRTSNSQGTACCPRRDRCKDGRKENGNKKHDTNDHTSDSGLAALCK